MIKLKNDYINLKDTIECGQMFRYFLLEDGSYDIVIKDRVLNVKQNGNVLNVSSNVEDNLKQVAEYYLDLNTDYKCINKQIINKNKIAEKYVEASKGLNTLRQDGFEMLLTYIISANNNVGSIKKSVNAISKAYGTKQQFNGKVYYLFPTPKQLANVTAQDYRKYSVGFRDKYLQSAVNKVLTKEVVLEKLKNMSSDEAMEYLQSLTGVGPKVASCILLFGFNRFDVFPIDTWVKKVVSTDFDVKPTPKAITEFVRKEFGEYSGLFVQYLFNFGRNKR